ncbi:Pyrimidine nucleotide transporter, mitochondrial [Yamadazyma tenuis]|uniref:Mitochondrial thiamine pyrophosphate carrier 1 n=1 Tax=Candida tenuis (strain ATCC 10573 / BCRC 21748 / CBS 615 / JCM 9827 / NBRC 10315 / NRRL Y-1498 / VKM Y-70) TaxID=590646 RepID=G3BB18_CANTC|nr:mitochondrial carrier [Yamadazyma tenuis ATCC 10573]EGV62122.1 mitochondrial carrier [Yamadazyma tenuis ATCC 10573]WEJ93374.1 Pyrimidine nucleotide transporter, mitochondrial [Yamadazyma tenuis]
MTRGNLNRIEVLEKDVEHSYHFLTSDEKSSTLREVEDVNYKSASQPAQVKSWVHFVAGGVGGMTGAILTCPLDVVKTRLQSDAYTKMYNRSPKSSNIIIKAAQHFQETGSVLKNIYTSEGSRALFRGLGPNLVGVIPARSINFFTYGLSKDFLSNNFNNGTEATWVHLLAGINAGFVTSTATNPIWLIKTRLQLDKTKGKHYKNSWDCFSHIVKTEGVTSLYRGLTASYLGGIESTLQWVLYEQMKTIINQRAVKQGSDKTTKDHIMEWSARSGAAGAAKFVASLITYPHEVVRTRLRQAPLESTGKPKYTGLIQTFKLVVKEEGMASMYGGLTPHLLRTVPNSIIMFGTWEIVVRLLS